MKRSDFKGKSLSLLGFGTMRLPQNADGTIDEAQTREMVRYAMQHGVNYFDTAWPYHGGESETVIGRMLSEYDRDSWYLATKFPGHQISSTYKPAALFERQLKKCGVEYFDFYLLHNVYENSLATYLDPQWGILDYFVEQKRLGRIRHLGFSTHGSLENLREVLDIIGDEMEFCQIQLNWLDWTLQEAKAKYDLLTERGIPVWVMEPVRGGKLVNLSETDSAKLKALRPDESVAAWSFRFLEQLPNVKMILSGMSDMAQMQDNVHTFEHDVPLSEEENRLLFSIAEGMMDSLPCTACRYCCDGCPMGLDIPMLLSVYNEIRILPTTNAVMCLDALAEEKKPSACIGCGKCTQICPQHIDVAAAMSDFTAAIGKIPRWADICREREAAQQV